MFGMLVVVVSFSRVFGGAMCCYMHSLNRLVISTGNVCDGIETCMHVKTVSKWTRASSNTPNTLVHTDIMISSLFHLFRRSLELRVKRASERPRTDTNITNIYANCWEEDTTRHLFAEHRTLFWMHRTVRTIQSTAKAKTIDSQFALHCKAPQIT